ncbi:MAG TPA: glucose 1-dehydrogenase [Xanthobacteraceae bacterium]|jgi:NAD(P)-dependent dehydrogenase (short-subunit alcohol dehydrogenase family)
MTVLDTYSLQGKAVLVTGAASGIGHAIATAFGEAGAAVGCADIDAGAAAETSDAIVVGGGKALPIACDVSEERDAAAAAAAVKDAFGAIHVLVNAAVATDPSGTVLDYTRTDWDRVFAINVTGVFLMSRAVLPAMIAAGGGSIIHLASQHARVGAPGRAVYCATKGALVMLAKSMAIDHAGQNIRVNALSPGAVETRRMTYRYGDMAAARAALGPKHLLKRLAAPDEIARAALFLASDASSFVTGSDLLVDGGFTAV